MSSDVSDYVALITSWHRARPRFVGTVSATAAPFADAQGLLAALPGLFDLDTAVGSQLDHVGERIGLSRQVPVPLPNLFFGFDDSVRGWDRGQWKGPYDSDAGVSFLSDDDYRRLLHSKILANNWDGTLPGAQASLNAYFSNPATRVFIQDNGYGFKIPVSFAWDRPNRGWDTGEWQMVPFSWDSSAEQGWDSGRWRAPLDYFGSPDRLSPSITIVLAGKIPSILDLAILDAGLIPIKPAGVTVDSAVTTIDNGPVFGFDLQNSNVDGWDAGAWGATPRYAIDHVA